MKFLRLECLCLLLPYYNVKLDIEIAYHFFNWKGYPVEEASYKYMPNINEKFFFLWGLRLTN